MQGEQVEARPLARDESRDVGSSAGVGEAWPARVHRREQAEKLFGALGSRLVPYLNRMDPLADEACAALAPLEREERRRVVEAAVAGQGPSLIPELDRLVASAILVPIWADEGRFERAGNVFRRAGVLGAITLGLRSLVLGYAAPAGNKPLAFSGRLTDKAQRRLAETSQFAKAVTDPKGLEPFAPGFRACLMVRLMHAEVRRLLLTSGRFRSDLWSAPINQHDMLATVLLFSNVFIGGIRMLGVTVTAEEADDYQLLFRRVGELLGVESRLLPASFREAERLSAFIRLTQGPPDEDSVALALALLNLPLASARSPSERKRAAALVRVTQGLCRGLVGEELADQLGLPRDSHRFWTTGLRSVFSVLERVRKGVPWLDAWVVNRGERYWQWSLREGLRGESASYEMPDSLRGKAPIVAT